MLFSGGRFCEPLINIRSVRRELHARFLRLRGSRFFVHTLICVLVRSRFHIRISARRVAFRHQSGPESRCAAGRPRDGPPDSRHAKPDRTAVAKQAAARLTWENFPGHGSQAMEGHRERAKENRRQGVI